MADEKEIKKELTDEQASGASGGFSARPRLTEELKMKQCSGPDCTKMIPDIPGNNYCDNCRRKFGIQTLI